MAYNGKIFEAIKTVKGGLKGNYVNKKKWKEIGTCATTEIKCDIYESFRNSKLYDRGDEVHFEDTIYVAIKKKVKRGLSSNKVNKKKWRESGTCTSDNEEEEEEEEELKCDDYKSFRNKKLYGRGDKVEFENTIYAAVKNKVKKGLGIDNVDEKKWKELGTCT